MIYALEVALLGVLIVFTVLSILILLITIQNRILEQGQGKGHVDKSIDKQEETAIITIEEAEEATEGLLSHHIVVISAAVTMLYGSRAVIRSIRPINEGREANRWELQSRMEQNR